MMDAHRIARGKKILGIVGSGALVAGFAMLPLAAASATSAAPSAAADSVTGTAIVVVDDGAPTVYLATGPRLTKVLGLSDEAATGRIASGDKVTAKLRVVADSKRAGTSRVAVASGGVATRVLKPEVNTNDLAPGSHEQHSIVVVRATYPQANLEGVPTPPPAPDLNKIETAVGNAATYWNTVSDDRIQFSRIVSKDKQALSATPCKPDLQALYDVGIRAGWTPSPLNHLVVMAPTVTGTTECTPNFRGFASLGGTRTSGGVVFLNGDAAIPEGTNGDLGWVLAHELGHNLGLGHANEVNCNDRNTVLAIDANPDTCRVQEYYGMYSAMAGFTTVTPTFTWDAGGFVAPHLTGRHLELLGLLDDTSVTDVMNRAGSVAEVTLTPAGAREGKRIARVESMDGDTYYFEYRTATADPKNLDNQVLGAVVPPLPSGVTVWKAFRAEVGTAFQYGKDLAGNPLRVDPRSDYLLDANPRNNPWNPAPIPVPMPENDPARFEGDPVLPLEEPVALGDLTVRLTAQSATEATFQVQFPSNGLRPAPRAPSAPLNVVAALSGPTTAKVTWSAPLTSNGAHITHYTVSSVPGEKTCQAVLPDGCEVTGLANGASYEFAVTATNAVGTSPFSVRSNKLQIGTPVTPTPTPTSTATPTPTPTPTDTATPTPTDTSTTTPDPTSTDTSAGNTVTDTSATDGSYTDTSNYSDTGGSTVDQASDLGTATDTGTSTGVPTYLPKTGADNVGWLLGSGGLLIVLGTAALLVARKMS